MQSDSKRDELKRPVEDPGTKGGGDVIAKGGDQDAKKGTPSSTNDDSARTPINTDQI
jgi:hypothetical protein